MTEDFGFDQGWTHFQSEHGFASLFETGPPALAWIEAQPADTPWFAFVHTYDTHRPYTRVGPWDHLWADGPGSKLAELVVRSPCLSELVFRDAPFPEIDPTWFEHTGGDKVLDPEVYRKLARGEAGRREVRLTDADRRHVVDHYDGAVQYADALLGLFLARLEAAGRLDHTVIIVVSDHGEDLLDHGYMNHRTGLTDSCTRVPTLVSGPGFTPGARVDGLVDARDVAATVVALGGALPPAGMQGRDLRAVARGEAPLDVVYSEGVMDMVSARSATHRLVYDQATLTAPDWVDRMAAAPLEAPAFELYDVVADPGERVNLLATPDDAARAVAGRLRDGLVAWRRGLTVGGFAADPSTVSPQVRARLREHGYWKAEGEADDVGGPGAPSPTDPGPAPAAMQCRERLLFLDEAGG